MKKALSAFAVLAIAAVTAGPSAAQQPQGFPSKPIRFVLPFSAGSQTDNLARMIGPKLAENLKQPVVIENRAGAGGRIGTSIVAKAAPDGYTLLFTSPAFAINAALQPDLPYDPRKDFAGVSQIGFGTSVLVVAPSLGVKSARELIALAQAQPGKVFFASAGAGSTTHLHGERFRLAAGIKAVHVGFKGAPEALIEVLSGRIQYCVCVLAPALPLIKDGRLVPLAVTIPKRSPALPEVPSMSEFLQGWGRDGSQLVLAPAGTPRAVLNRLSGEFARILVLPEIREKMASIGYQAEASTPEETDKIIRAQLDVFSRVVSDAGLRPK